ncbi:MAG: bacterial Ig-like domain-containing protein [Clostridia bacterium]
MNKKKTKVLVVMLIVVLALVSMAACIDNTVSVTDIKVDRKAISAKFYIGDDNVADFSKLKVMASMSDGSEVEIKEGKYELDKGGFDIKRVGVYTITVKYGGIIKTFLIAVKERTAQKGNYVIDGDTMVIFAGFSYTFGEATNLVLKQGDKETAITDSELIVSETGEYILNYVNAAGESKSQKLRVIDRLLAFENGKSRTAYESTISKINDKTSDYINKTVAPYFVGSQNPFYFDIELTSNQSGKEVLPTTDVVNYEFMVKEGETYKAVKTEDVAELIDGYKFLFKNELAILGKELKVTMTAKYSDKIEGYADFNPIVVEFVLNVGYNVFTHEDLQKYYSARYCQQIDIHREIIPILKENQFNPDKSPKNIYPDGGNLNKYVEYNENGEIIRNDTACSYIRWNENIKDDKMVINGNYFTINGRNLPLFTANTKGYPDQPKALSIANYQLEVVNPQSAIFISLITSSDWSAQLNAADSTLTTAQFNAISANKMIYNNLTILGNTETPKQGSMTEEEAYRIAIADSGSYSAIRTDGCDIEVNNSVIKFTCMGVFLVSAGTDCKLKETRIEESWSYNAYGYGSANLEMEKCIFNFSGGGSVWLEDKNYKWGEVFDANFVMDNETVINNFVSGTETWFGTNGMGTVAAQAKAMINDTVTKLTGGKRTIIKKTTNSAGAVFESFNFAIIIIERYDMDIPSGVIIPQKGSIKIGTLEILRKTAELAQDPRNTQSGFVAPVGALSDTMAYIGEIGRIVTMYIAGDVATKEMVDGYMAASGITDLKTAVAYMVLGNSMCAQNTNYLEITQVVPNIGTLTALTAIFDA